MNSFGPATFQLQCILLMTIVWNYITIWTGKKPCENCPLPDPTEAPINAECQSHAAAPAPRIKRVSHCLDDAKLSRLPIGRIQRIVPRFRNNCARHSQWNSPVFLQPGSSKVSCYPSRVSLSLGRASTLIDWGLTADCVLIHADTSVHLDQLSSCFGYIAQEGYPAQDEKLRGRDLIKPQCPNCSVKQAQNRWFVLPFRALRGLLFWGLRLRNRFDQFGPVIACVSDVVAHAPRLHFLFGIWP